MRKSLDYTVGSLADLISGSNTPNKPKVVQKKVKAIKREIPNTAHVEFTRKLNKNKRKLSESNAVSDRTEDGPMKKKRKRKFSENKAVSDSNKVSGSMKKKKRNFSESSAVSDRTEDSSSKKKKKKLSENSAVSHISDLVDSDDDGGPMMKPSQNDTNAERRVKDKEKAERREVEAARTLFVGNCPMDVPKNKIKKFFGKYGIIETLRFRGIPVADPNTPKKVAAIKKEFHPKRNSLICFIRFAKAEDALKAEKDNGILFKGHHLRLQCSASKGKPDESKAIFIGNLSFEAEEEELWRLFETCGPISSVRIVRDPRSGLGKGFAYINFKESDAVQLALEMENVTFKDRELRVSHCNLGVAKKNKQSNKMKKINRAGRFKTREQFDGKRSDGKKKPDGDGTQKAHREYQGSVGADKKKKHKVNKGFLQKKRNVKKIAPKPKEGN